MNPNQLMLSKAIVTQTALRDVARESRRRTSRDRRQGTGDGHRVLGLLRRR